MDMTETIGDRIAILLKKSKYNQKELASLVGVTEATMSRYMNNERVPKAEIIANLATALHTTSDYLISGQETNEEFEPISRIVARGAKNMTQDQKMELIRILLENDYK